MKAKQPRSPDADVIIIGAGIAGLVCGGMLSKEGHAIRVFEASDRIGGRLKTDRVDGFLLDHGFQVLQTAYSEARALLDYESLKLRAFDPGAVVRSKGAFYRVADPLRCPRYGLETFLAPVGTFPDKLRLVRLMNRIIHMDDERIYERPELPAWDYLREEGFTEKMIASFFRPFFSGVCLDPDISASSRVFHFVFKMLALGDAVLPAKGIEAIPAQLAEAIPGGSIRTGARVVDLGDGWVRLEKGERVTCQAVVMATDGPSSHQLVGAGSPVPSCGVHCLYFAASRPPMREKFLVLNGEETGPINNLTVLSNVAPSYAPPGQSLIAVTALDALVDDRDSLEEDIRSQLESWYGPGTRDWRLLKTFHITHGLPQQTPPTPNPFRVNPRVKKRLYVCGEYGSVPSIQWAMVSGRKAAEAVMEDFRV